VADGITDQDDVIVSGKHLASDGERVRTAGR
jgi:hypothetical protein